MALGNITCTETADTTITMSLSKYINDNINIIFVYVTMSQGYPRQHMYVRNLDYFSCNFAKFVNIWTINSPTLRILEEC